MVTKSPGPESELTHAANMHRVPFVLSIVGEKISRLPEQFATSRLPLETLLMCTTDGSKVMPMLIPFMPLALSFVLTLTGLVLPTIEMD